MNFTQDDKDWFKEIKSLLWPFTKAIIIASILYVIVDQLIGYVS